MICVVITSHDSHIFLKLLLKYFIQNLLNMLLDTYVEILVYEQSYSKEQWFKIDEEMTRICVSPHLIKQLTENSENNHGYTTC